MRLPMLFWDFRTLFLGKQKMGKACVVFAGNLYHEFNRVQKLIPVEMDRLEKNQSDKECPTEPNEFFTHCR